jgi:hypothetical protein
VRTEERRASVTIDQLEEGMVLVNNAETEKGQVLLRANSELTTATILVLQKWGSFDRVREPILVKVPS